jgi:hypothetical protein
MRLDSAHGALWRLTVGFGTDLKIMVSPVRIRVPPLKKTLQNVENLRTPVTEPEPIYCNRDSVEGFVHRPCRRAAHSWEDVGVGVEGNR